MVAMPHLRRRCHPMIVLLSASAILSSCGRSIPTAEVTITRSVLIAVGTQNPKILVSDEKGGFVVAGSDSIIGPHAGDWAERVDGSGRKLWEYHDSAIPPKGSAEFSGAAMLSDGGVLLCGHENTEHAQEALLVKISADAQVVYKHFVRPADDTDANWNSFSSCIPWDGGIAVLGSASTLTPFLGFQRPSGWIIKFDATGQRQIGRRGKAYLADEALEASNHDLILLDTHFNGGSRVVRINERGDVIASITIKGVEAHFLHPLTSTTRLRLFALQWTGPDRYITLDGDLRVVGDEKSARLGPRKAYGLRDGTALLFGSTRGPDMTAVISLRYPNSFIETHALAPLHESGWIIDAVPTGKKDEFLTVRNISGIYRQSFADPWVNNPRCTPECVELSWVTIKTNPLP